MAACQAVFSTYELLEAVLVKLPPFELVTASQVCSAWRALIRDSSRFPGVSPVSPMPRSDLLPSMRDETIYPHGTRLRLNPMLPHRAEGKREWSEVKRTQQSLRVPHHVYQFSFDRCQLRKRLREHVRIQFVTLPPVTRVTFGFSKDWRSANRQSREVVERAAGVRLGDIEPVVQRLLASKRCISPTELRVLYDPDLDT